MKIIVRSLMAVLILVSASAEIVKSKGKGEIVYKGIKQSAEDERQAIAAAKKNALSKFAAGYDSARFELYQKIEKSVLADLDQFVPDFTQLDQQLDKTSKRYTVIIEASINSTLIENAIQKNSATSAPRAAAAGTEEKSEEASYVTFIFVARELAARKSFDDKRTTVDVKETTDQGVEKNKIAEDGQSAERSVEKTSVAKNTVGGNTESKAEELAFRVTTVTEVDNAVNSVLTKANYETVDAVDVGLDVDAFKKDFSGGNDIAPPTRTAAVKSCREQKIAFLAVANMDIGLPEKDPNTGMTRVFVTVTAKVSDLTPKFPKTVASIAGKPFAGLGSNAQVAKQNALNEAATKSAMELVDQLRVKNVK